MIKSDKPIYKLLESHLRTSTTPITCVELMDRADIRKEALKEYGGKERDVRLATNKLSDALGLMWRKGFLTRYPAARSDTSLSRYAYIWATREEVPAKAVPPPPKPSSKQIVNVTERDGLIEIELDKFIIVVRPK